MQPGKIAVARFAVDEYSKVLTSDELERFLADENEERPR
jgi:hypothetical protein